MNKEAQVFMVIFMMMIMFGAYMMMSGGDDEGGYGNGNLGGDGTNGGGGGSGTNGGGGSGTNGGGDGDDDYDLLRDVVKTTSGESMVDSVGEPLIVGKKYILETANFCSPQNSRPFVHYGAFCGDQEVQEGGQTKRCRGPGVVRCGLMPHSQDPHGHKSSKLAMQPSSYGGSDAAAHWIVFEATDTPNEYRIRMQTSWCPELTDGKCPGYNDPCNYLAINDWRSGRQFQGNTTIVLATKMGSANMYPDSQKRWGFGKVGDASYTIRSLSHESETGDVDRGYMSNYIGGGGCGGVAVEAGLPDPSTRAWKFIKHPNQ